MKAVVFHGVGDIRLDDVSARIDTNPVPTARQDVSVYGGISSSRAA
jgi:hypothetical protein